MPAIRIRPATADDTLAVTMIAHEAYAPYVPRIGRKPAPMTADHALLIERGQVWVAVAAGSVTGFAVIRPVTGALHLESVAVSPDRQGEGVGRALLEFVEQRARALRLPAVELYTNALMTENLALYPRLGYVETERRREHGFDRVYFHKRLAP
jgi:ribosomal protein S18 acetylase RimI-like enzyme